MNENECVRNSVESVKYRFYESDDGLFIPTDFITVLRFFFNANHSFLGKLFVHCKLESLVFKHKSIVQPVNM